jgi:16S rRNA (cytosine967-C5)-methyltransferase
MRLGGRCAAAAEVLAEIAARRRPATEALKDWGNAHRFAGSADRSAVGNLVFDVLRRRASLAWRLGGDDPAALVVGALLGDWGMDAAAIAAAFRDDPHAPNFPDSALEHFRHADLADAPDPVRADIQDWCVGHFAGNFGENWIAEARALADRPPLDLRANTLKCSRDKALKQLARLRPRPGGHAPTAIRIPAPERDSRLPNIQAEPAYAKGWIEIQDEGSQLAAIAVGARPGEQVLDYCAGGGGKSLALAAIMENRGQVHAHDADRRRLAPIHERLRRAGARNVQVHDPLASSLAALAGRMDRVLVDAPCTGSGTWRRRPDAKWRIEPPAIVARTGEQDAALDAAAPFVRPGGTLAYVTCSMFAAENGERTAAFLARNPAFAPAEGIPALSALCAGAQMRLAEGYKVDFTPLRTATDGFFVAVMKRKP